MEVVHCRTDQSWPFHAMKQVVSKTCVLSVRVMPEIIQQYGVLDQTQYIILTWNHFYKFYWNLWYSHEESQRVGINFGQNLYMRRIKWNLRLFVGCKLTKIHSTLVLSVPQNFLSISLRLLFLRLSFRDPTILQRCSSHESLRIESSSTSFSAVRCSCSIWRL